MLLATIGLVGTLVAPVLAIAVGITLSVRWRAWEAVLIGVLLDIVWIPALTSFGFPIATMCALAIVWGLEPLRREFL